MGRTGTLSARDKNMCDRGGGLGNGGSQHFIGHRVASLAIDSSKLTYFKMTSISNANLIGAFSSLTAGSGMDLSDESGALKVYSDDAGAALSGSRRGVLSRVLFTVDQSAGITMRGVQGQLKFANLVDVTGAAVLSGVEGYMEFSGTGNRTLTGHVAGVRSALEEGASGTTTIAASSYYSGFEATLNSTRTYTQTGDMAAFMANISGGTSKWPVGLFLDDGAITTGIYIGTGTTVGIDCRGKARCGTGAGATNGIAVTGTDPDYVFQSHASIATDVGAAAYAASYHTMTITASQSSNSSIFASWAELYITGDLTLTNSNHGAMWGNLEMADAGGSLTTQGGDSWMGALVATVISPDGLVNNSMLAGVLIDSNITSGYTNNGTIAAIITRKSGSSVAWPYGLYHQEGAVTGDVKVQQEDANDLPCVIFSGTAVNDGDITTDVGADTLWADGSLYISVVDGAGKLFQKQNDVWVDLQA